MQQRIDFQPHPNSLNVYLNNILPELSKRQNDVLCALRYLGEATIGEVAMHLGVFPNVISGRFGELRKMSAIKEVGNKVINNKTHAIWKSLQ